MSKSVIKEERIESEDRMKGEKKNVGYGRQKNEKIL